MRLPPLLLLLLLPAAAAQQWDRPPIGWNAWFA